MKSSLELGLQACQEGRFQQAVAILEATTQVSPDDPRVWLALARAYRGAGDLPKAIAAYRLVLNARPPDDVLAEAEGELAALEHKSKSVIEAAMRPACAACGARLPASRAARPWCLCGWNSRTPPVIGRQIFLSDIYAYAAGRGVIVSFRRREDVYLVAKHQLRLQGIGSRTHPVDPRLALGARDRLAVVLQDELRPISPETAAPDALYRVRPIGQSHGAGQFLNWRQFAAHLAEVEDTDVTMRMPDTSLAAVLASEGMLTADQVGEIRKAKSPDETIGQTLLRLRLVSLDGILKGALGAARLGPLPLRPIALRLGERLVAEGLIERRQLKQALFLQSQFKRPLGELLVEARFVGPGDVQDMIEHLAPLPGDLPHADSLGELLIASKLISRTQLLSIEGELVRLGVGDLEEFLRTRHLVPDDQLDRALSWQERKREICRGGLERLGEILIAQRAITAETLGQALMRQVDDPRPLGTLLVAVAAITPEQLVAALEEQDRRRNRLAWREEDESLHGTQPLGASPGGAASIARATTRALTRVLVADDTPEPPPGRRRKRKRRRRRMTPWRLIAAGAIVAFALAIGGGVMLGRATNPGSAAEQAAP